MLKSIFTERTHVGLVRSNNEDSFCSLPEIGLWAIADGMGGHDAGEVASAITVQALVKSVREGHSLQQGIEYANQSLRRAFEGGCGSKGMGTTIVALRELDSEFEVAWVGDSRAYLYSGSKLQQITKDHSIVQSLIDQGFVAAKDARIHPQRHVVTRALRGEKSASLLADTVRGDLYPGAAFLLCSDGLSDLVSEEEIVRILAQRDQPDEALDSLLQAALDAGGMDNITIQMIKFDEITH